MVREARLTRHTFHWDLVDHDALNRANMGLNQSRDLSNLLCDAAVDAHDKGDDRGQE